MSNFSRLSTCFASARVRVAILVVAVVAVFANRFVVASASNLTFNTGIVDANVDQGPNVPGVIALDEFAVEGTLSVARAGGLWSQQGSIWNSTLNSVAALSPGPAVAYLTMPGVVDGILDVAIDTRASSRAGVFLRDDSTNGIVVLYRHVYQGNVPSELQFFVRTSGAPLAIPIATVPVAAADKANLRVVISGSIVTVSWNGAVALSYELNRAQTAAVSGKGSTHWGLWVEQGESPRYSHFRVKGVVKS
jgi:hypothetical protein